MSRTEELKSRIQARVKQLEADLVQAKADAQGKRNDRMEAIEAKLKEARTAMREGWDDLTEDMARKLNQALS